MGQIISQVVTTFLFLLITILAGNAYGQAKIVGISIACSNDHVYTWYSDHTVSVGTSENLSAYQAPHQYSLPFGKTPEDIVEIGIASNDHVYTWYHDSTVSSGTSTDLDKYQPRHPFTQSRLKSIASSSGIAGIVGIDIACSDDHVYVWYQDGTVTSGTSDDLGKYRDSYRYFFSPFPSSILGIGIARNDHVYAWFADKTATSGTSEDLRKYRNFYKYVFGPGPCDISADPPKIAGHTVFGVGIRGPTCQSTAEVLVRLRAVDADPQHRILIEKRLTGTNFELPVTYACTGNRQQTLWTEVESLGRVVKSVNTTIACF